MIDDDERRIREKAYELWVAEGRPEGRAEAHWQEAREIIATRDSLGTTLVPLKDTLGDDAEPALAFENQGEFPDLRDEGQSQDGPTLESAIDGADRTGLSVGDDAPKRGRPRSSAANPSSAAKPEAAAKAKSGASAKPAGTGRGRGGRSADTA